MTVYVDELQQWPGAKRPFHAGSCHLTCDGPEAELHAFAHKLGLKGDWYQPHRIANHYDLTPGKRERALKLGAVFMRMREQLRRRRENQWSNLKA